MIHPRVALLATLVLLGASTSGNAAMIFTATLTNDQENPPVVPTLDGVATPRPVSFGSATFVLNDAMTELTISATVFNIDFGRVPSQGTPVANPPNANPNPQTADILNDDLLVAHLHRGPVGTNGPVIFGFIGTPFNDNNPNDVVVTPFATGSGERSPADGTRARATTRPWPPRSRTSWRASRTSTSTPSNSAAARSAASSPWSPNLPRSPWPASGRSASSAMAGFARSGRADTSRCEKRWASVEPPGRLDRGPCLQDRR